MLEFFNKGRITVQSNQREPAWRPARAIDGAENAAQHIPLCAEDERLAPTVPLAADSRCISARGRAARAAAPDHQRPRQAPGLLARHRPMRRICRRRPRAGGHQARPQYLSQLGRRARNPRSPTPDSCPDQLTVLRFVRSRGGRGSGLDDRRGSRTDRRIRRSERFGALAAGRSCFPC